jgi:hypothetical protein
MFKVVCGNCGKEGTKKQLSDKCSGCKQVRYCSHQCAKVHWKRHKLECPSFSNAGAASEGHAAVSSDIESLEAQVRKLQEELAQLASSRAEPSSDGTGAATADDGGGGGTASHVAPLHPCPACLVCDEGGTLPGKKGVCGNCATIFCSDCWTTASAGLVCPVCQCAFEVCYDKREREERLWMQSEKTNAINGAMVSRRLFELYNDGCVICNNNNNNDNDDDDDDDDVDCGGDDAKLVQRADGSIALHSGGGDDDDDDVYSKAGPPPRLGGRSKSAAWSRLLRRAKIQELADAQFLLGMAHVDGRGVKKDPEKGMMEFRRAGWKAHAIALDKVIASAEAGGKDPEAVQALLNAANKGVVTAQYLFGKCYIDGKATSTIAPNSLCFHHAWVVRWVGR